VNIVLDSIFVLLILTSFSLLGSSRLGTGIRMVALQGVTVGLLPLAWGGEDLSLRVVVISAVVIGMKGLIFPRLLSRSLREVESQHETQPFVGYIASLFIGVLSVIASFWLESRLSLPADAPSALVVPVAFSTMMMGLFVIVARRTALNQVLGYLVLENGVYTFGLAIVRDIPVLVELGVLMDMFVAVFVMGSAIYRISREFDHMDSDQLNTLRG
jgi:hydrogenase-4 component E